jgi:hypothetical protein
VISRRQKRISIDLVASQTRLPVHVIQHCIQVGLVGGSLTRDDLAELRRVRRLTELEVNLAGVEIIVRMRRRIMELQSEVVDLKTSAAQAQE